RTTREGRTTQGVSTPGLLALHGHHPGPPAPAGPVGSRRPPLDGEELTRIVVTGHNGQIGSALVPKLTERGHELIGLDSFLFAGCTLGPDVQPVETIVGDVRDVTVDQLHGFDGVVHLAGLSNDPLGDVDADLTYDINHRGTVHVAEM